jgi:hypothetical protein
MTTAALPDPEEINPARAVKIAKVECLVLMLNREPSGCLSES